MKNYNDCPLCKGKIKAKQLNVIGTYILDCRNCKRYSVFYTKTLRITSEHFKFTGYKVVRSFGYTTILFKGLGFLKLNFILDLENFNSKEKIAILKTFQ